MAFTLNIIAFTVALAFILSISVLPPNLAISPLSQVLNGQLSLTTAIDNFFSTSNAPSILAFGAAVAIGVTFFPNMWAIFLLPTLAIFGWSIFPTNLFNTFLVGISNPIITDPTFGLIAILNGMFQIAFILSVVSWYKGQEAI